MSNIEEFYRYKLERMNDLYESCIITCNSETLRAYNYKSVALELINRFSSEMEFDEIEKLMEKLDE